MNFRAFSVTKTPPAWIADTCVGTKTNVKSYRCIATMSGAPEHRFLFLSDVTGELDAARSQA